MRVNFRRTNQLLTVAEIIQMVRYDSDEVGLVLPYSKNHEQRGFDAYQSTEKVDESEYNHWCEQLMRNGYLDLSRTKFVFRTGKG